MKHIEYIKIEELHLYGNNPNKHSAKQIELLKNSLLEFGFIVPLLVDEKNVILAGEGRLLAAKKAGIEDIPVIRMEDLTEEQKKALVISDNKLALNSKWDMKLLKEELRFLYNSGFDILSIGFDMSAFKKTTEEIKNTEITLPEGTKELDMSKIKKCPKCGFEYIPR